MLSDSPSPTTQALAPSGTSAPPWHISHVLPRIKPMLLSNGPLPSDDDRWLYEVKYDGWRAIVYLDRGELAVRSRNDRVLTRQVPELEPLAVACRRRQLILDGELVSFGEGGRPDFGALQGRMLNGSRAPVAYMIFDVLFDDQDLTRKPLEERRARLSRLELKGDAWQTVTYSTSNGPALLATSREHPLEGLVAKRCGSVYEPGKRSASWRKIKNYERREYIVGGYTLNARGGLESVLLGEEREGALHFVGRIEYAPHALLGVLETLRAAAIPMRGGPRRSVYVQPRLVADVKCLAGADGLRHATLVGVRVRSE